MGSHRAASRPALYSRMAAAGALAFMIMALLSVSPLSGPASAATGTYVRFAQLTPDMAGNELLLSSVSDPQRSVTIPGLPYGGLSEYRLVQPGDYVAGITPKGSAGAPAVSLTLNAMSGGAYTLAAVGKSSRTGLSILTDDLTPPEPGNAKIRVIGAAATAPTLDVRGPGGEIALGLPYAQASAYRAVPAGPSTLTVGPPGGATVSLPINVAANQVASVVLVERGGAIAADVRVDAEGPAQIPPGAIKAGFGGAAAGQPSEATGVITFGALAAAAAVLSRVLSRRTRSARPGA
jgi:Domain of unknown function (DUF4397)